MHKMTGHVWDPKRLVILVQKSKFCMKKQQVWSLTDRSLQFQSKSRCFASKNHTWWLGQIETSNSCAKVADLHAQNHTWGLGPIQTCKTGPKVTVLHEEKNTDKGWNPYRLVILVQIMLFLHAQDDRWGLGLIETCNSAPKGAGLNAKARGTGWDP